MSRSARFVLLTFLAAATVYAQDEATQLLRQVVETYGNLTTYRLELTAENWLTSELHHSWQKEVITLAVEEPSKVRFESQADTGWYVVVSDGKTLWRAAPYSREWSRSSLAGPLSEAKGGGSEAAMALGRMRQVMNRYQRIVNDLKDARIVREEPLELDGMPVECTVVRADYNPPRGSVGIRTWTRTFWIDKRRHIVLQDESVTRGSLMPEQPFKEAESRWKTRLTRISIGAALPDSLFSYTAPPNFREVDKLERAYPRPATSLVGKPAPELALKTLEGRSLTLSSLRGKTVLLDFWATWCAPCREQMPALAKLNSEMKGQEAVLLGVNDDEAAETALKFMREHQYEWTSLFSGPNGDARDSYKVDAIPALVVIDRNGVIVEYQIGSGSTAEKSIRAALRKQGIQVQE